MTSRRSYEQKHPPNPWRGGVDAGFEPVLVLINVQEFTKTANCWGVNNNNKGTNTNRVVVFRKAL